MKKAVLALAGTIAIASGVAAPIALASNSTVHVTIRTLSRTLVSNKAVHGQTGYITKGGTPNGKCPASSAAGALNAATHGRWTGKYYASVEGIFITSILGVKPSGSDYWNVYVNGKSSSQGICAIKLKRNESLRFAIVR
jgi:hypothetical protein